MDESTAPPQTAMNTSNPADKTLPPKGTRNETARLAEALKPFAALLHDHHSDLPDARPIYVINEAQITAGDLRRANAALLAHEHAADASPETGLLSERDKDVWRAALTLANNLCVQESDRENDRDGDAGWIDGTAECARRIRDYLTPGDLELAEMLGEAGVKSRTAEQSSPRVGKDREVDGLADAVMDALFVHEDWRGLCDTDPYHHFERKPLELRRSILHALARALGSEEKPAARRGGKQRKP